MKKSLCWQLVRKEKRLRLQLRRLLSSKGVGTQDGNFQVKQLPREADVVIIGGGVIGCSTLYNLAKIGVTNTVLLEAHKLTAGTTWHSSGVVSGLRANDTEIKLLKETIRIAKGLEEETGINPGWVQNGSLYVATNKTRMDEYKRLHTLGKGLDVESHVLGPDETKKFCPHMNVSDVYGTLYVPSDGALEPTGFCDGLVRYATTKGAKIFEKCRVENITVEPTPLDGKQVKEVNTSQGSIRTSCVVNATGCWANDIGSMVGTKIPVVPIKHAYVATESIPGIEKTPNVRDHDISTVFRVIGQSYNIGAYELNPAFIDKLDKDFSFSLYDFDWEIFAPLMEASAARFPVLAETGIKATVYGPEAFTPDRKPIMGEDPDVGGFFHASAFNSGGIMLAGGCGQQLAQWIVKGRPDYDMYNYDVRRFYPTLAADEKWAKERSHETYAKLYSTVFPRDAPLAGRGKRKSSLHRTLEDAGCIFEEKNGWERPIWFFTKSCPVQPYDWYGQYGVPANTDKRYQEALQLGYSFSYSQVDKYIREDCIACRTHAALFDMSDSGQHYLTGPDASAAADWLFSADVNKPVGSVVTTCMLKDTGGIESILPVAILDDQHAIEGDPPFEGQAFFLVTDAASATHNLAHIKKEIRKNKWNVKLSDRTEEMALLSLQGPSSRDIMKRATPEVDFTNNNFPYGGVKTISIAGHKVRAIRESSVGELGWELHLPTSGVLDVYKELHKMGDDLQLVNAGYRALNSLSAEKGHGHWHEDLRPDDSPLEAGLEDLCKIESQVNFLGKEALEKQKRVGFKKKLITFTTEGGPLWGMETIWRDDHFMGIVRRADTAYALGKVIVYGYIIVPNDVSITNDFLTEGCWEIEVMGEKRRCTAHTTHPFDPNNHRLNGIYEEKEQIKILENFRNTEFIEKIKKTDLE